MDSSPPPPPPSYLVRRLDLTEADVSVYAEDDVLDGQLRDRLIHINDSLRGRFNKRLPVLQSSSVLLVVSCAELAMRCAG